MADKQTTPQNAPKTNPFTPFGPAQVRLNKNGIGTPLDGFRGGKSVKVCEIDVPLMGAGIVITCAVYGRFNPTQDGHEITFEAALPKSVSSVGDDERDAILGHAERAALAYPSWEQLSARAENSLLGRKTVAASDKPQRVKLARLIGTDGQTVATAAVATA